MNPKTQAIIDAAKERTRLLLAAQKQLTQPSTEVLPPSTHFQLGYKDPMKEVKEQHTLTVLPNKLGFDPYDLPGVGRANKEQSLAIDLFGIKGLSGCLIGPAGTGKTTTMRAIINAAVLCGRIPILDESMAHKYLHGGVAGIYGGSFTRIATRNLRDNFPKEYRCNVHTIHRLLEFEPEIFETTDPQTGKIKKVRIFKPTRNKYRTLDPNLVTFFLDETSMVGTRLHAQFIDAIDCAEPQIVYIGDIAQIPPVMDDAILGYKMLEFIPKGQLVELIQVYRHAGAIVNLANSIRIGNTIPTSNDIARVEHKAETKDNRYLLPYLGNLRKLPFAATREFFRSDGWDILEDKLFRKEQDGSIVTIRFWKNRLDGDVGQLKALQNLGLAFFPKELEEGRYDPMKDMILMPYNKAVGTLELNKYIAGYLSRKREAEVHEVISGYVKHYFAVGDKVFYEREEAVITKISMNGLYAGKGAQAPAVTLDRWGHNTAGMAERMNQQNVSVDDLDILLNIEIGGDDEERKNQASHVIHLRKLVDLDDKDIEDDSIQTAAEINGLIFGYALTIHKSQGSQWPKVYCVFHNSHNRNLQRELLYTAITRAQKELYIIAEPETFVQGVLSQHIEGNTLEAKAEFFKGKIEEKEKRDDIFNQQNGKGIKS